MDWTEEFNKEFQQQTGPNIRKNSELENRLFEIIQSEGQKVKRMKGKKCLGFMRHHQ